MRLVLCLLALAICAVQAHEQIRIGQVIPFCYYNQTSVAVHTEIRNDLHAIKGLFDHNQHYFDYAGGRWRNFGYYSYTEGDEKHIHSGVENVLSLKKEHATYLIYKNKTCVKSSYTGALSPQCYGSFTVQRQTSLLGQKVHVLTTNQTTKNGDMVMFQLYAQITPDGHLLPVVLNQYQTGLTGYLATYDYEGYHKGVDNPSSVFSIPPECNKKGVRTISLEQVREELPVEMLPPGSPWFRV
eukprot:TRINITY_DN68145_c10_g2_i1.p1 TRINITY_DN68145_c10_g2~~TRINITY_DN68145_c10_g2_i1.p1  ORF type:complete len:241 (-),score=31.02 TRINITY_DN68145_c10_g2_i1:169-891(-)